MNDARRIIFGGGGTGGHLYPGLAIWREIEAREPSGRVSALFICSAKTLDAEVLSREGVEFLPIPARAFGARPAALYRFLRGWGPSVRAARRAIRRARDEGASVVVAAMGGYVAAPVVQAARAEGVASSARVLVNLDAVPGKANGWIARHAGVLLTAANSSRVDAAWERIPPIVRRGAANKETPEAARAALGLAPDRPTLVVTGGSQGAGSLNGFVTAFAARHAQTLRSGRWQVLHQTGKGEEEKCAAAYRTAGVDAVVTAFVTEMACAWGAADAAVARCGANTVAELWSNRVPSLLLPYPYHKDQHQKFNAEPLERCGGAVVRTDLIDPVKNLESSGEALLGLVSSAERRSAMRRALETLGPTDGAAQVARRLLAL